MKINLPSRTVERYTLHILGLTILFVRIDCINNRFRAGGNIAAKANEAGERAWPIAVKCHILLLFPPFPLGCVCVCRRLGEQKQDQTRACVVLSIDEECANRAPFDYYDTARLS